jgi:hypothetical protein
MVGRSDAVPQRAGGGYGVEKTVCILRACEDGALRLVILLTSCR